MDWSLIAGDGRKGAVDQIHTFMSKIVFEHNDFDYNSLSRDNIFDNTITIIKRALKSIDPINRPSHNFNEDKKGLIVYFFDGSE